MWDEILVTGGNGFVGRNLVSRLIDESCSKITIVDPNLTGKPPEEWLPESHKQEGNVFSINGVQIKWINDDARTFLKHNREHYDLVVHLAAVIGGRESIDGEPLRVATDLSIDAEFFNWVIESEPGQVVYASSSAAYPIELQSDLEKARKLRETDIELVSGGYELDSDDNLDISFKPDMTYGWSKLTGEYLSRFASSHYGIDTVCIRPFSGYGPDQDFSYPIPAIAKRAYQKSDPLTIWGSGNQTRDFIYIDDCIDGLLLAAEKIDDGKAVNLGTGVGTNFWEVAEIMSDIVGYTPSIENIPEKPEGVKYRVTDTEYMRSYLGFEPEVTVREGFKKVISEMDNRVK